MTLGRTKQCAACPWKKSTNPHTDISGNYDPKKHEKLIACQAPGSLTDELRAMACHESSAEEPYACVGWVVNQLGPGNNVALRLKAAFDPNPEKWRQLKTFGEQHDTIEEMVATAKRGAR